MDFFAQYDRRKGNLGILVDSNSMLQSWPFVGTDYDLAQWIGMVCRPSRWSGNRGAWCRQHFAPYTGHD
ncbi:hypothetical protein TSA66_00150 [Noviherbaspirillum autotrophicum]|uniref:Uncharacterized protein n=1 Tax=Noviherbaspirillum autotrophicum TaxID=709839 RepID=A0A0C2BXG7_9BURK|nr:hypothetical protein TSA66_20880 [Noviherbaspirillum autotrophicum]KIF84176.1 hypothetical protein TSA66_00150 [Noviherbaspirillum autotrophicum]